MTPAWAERWWNPPELLAEVRNKMDAMPGDALMGNPGKPIREAWAAALFATIRHSSCPCVVRLADGQFPDFGLREDHSGVVLNFELTEADKAGRRRYSEYRDGAAKCSHVDPDEEAQAIKPVIAQRVKDGQGSEALPAQIPFADLCERVSAQRT
jgi:hypothetical protein